MMVIWPAEGICRRGIELKTVPLTLINITLDIYYQLLTISNMKLSRPIKFIIAIFVPQMTGAIGSFFTTPSIPTWYAELAKPELAPPNWVFAPVWISLFILMGVAAFLVWDKGLGRRKVQIALGVFVFQLVLNTLWSVIFFGFQNPGWALAWIILLNLIVVVNIYLFARISRLAGLILLPYLLWLGFATYLNYAIWVLN